MNKKSILNRQIEKLKSPDFHFRTWVLETSNLFDKIFTDSETRKTQLNNLLNQPGAGLVGLNLEKLIIDWSKLLEGYIFELEIDKTQESLNQMNNETQLDKSKIFIVHGHDDEVKEKVARFITKIGFEPIILHEQASGNKTIIEKIEAYSNVGFALVLYTPCDKGSMNKNSVDLRSRARQNVVFEHGYFIGKLGRNKVCALVKSDIEIPNDISGIVYIPIDSGDSWKFSLAKEMKEASYDVDMNLI